MSTLTKDEIRMLIMEEPKLLLKTGKVLNTWRLIMGQSIIPTFHIKYMEAITNSGEYVTLYDFEGLTGYDEDGTPYDITDISRIVDIDVHIYFERSYLSNLSAIEDVVYYPPESRYVTLAYLMDIETEPLYINPLPMFDHTKIKYNFRGNLVIGIDNYPKILQKINYMGCNLNPDYNGMVRFAYEVEVPYTMFYNRKVHNELVDIIPGVPLVQHTLTVTLV